MHTRKTIGKIGARLARAFGGLARMVSKTIRRLADPRRSGERYVAWRAHMLAARRAYQRDRIGRAKAEARRAYRLAATSTPKRHESVEVWRRRKRWARACLDVVEQGEGSEVDRKRYARAFRRALDDGGDP